MTTTTRNYILTTELEWTMARMICDAISNAGNEGKSLNEQRLAWVVRAGGGKPYRKLYQDMPSYGSLRFLPEVRIRAIIDFLIKKEVISKTMMEDLVLTSRGTALLEGRYLGATGYLHNVYPLHRDER